MTLPEHIESLDLFREWATRLAHQLDPGFPVLHEGGLELIETYYADSTYQADQRTDGRGWVLTIEKEHLGPGDVVEQNTWRAQAYGLGWTLHREATRGHERIWVTREPLEAPPVGL